MEGECLQANSKSLIHSFLLSLHCSHLCFGDNKVIAYLFLCYTPLLCVEYVSLLCSWWVGLLETTKKSNVLNIKFFILFSIYSDYFLTFFFSWLSVKGELSDCIVQYISFLQLTVVITIRIFKDCFSLLVQYLLIFLSDEVFNGWKTF